MRSSAYVASFVAALLALVPAVTRLYESVAGSQASPSLYLAWLLLWIVTGSGLLWTAFGSEGPRRTRVAIGVAGGAMLLALVTTVTAVADPPTAVPAALAALSHAAVAGGAAVCAWNERRVGRLTSASWAIAALGATSLALASLLFLYPNQTWFGIVSAAGTFVLAAGLSLAVGQYGERNALATPGAAASQEP